MDHLKMFVECAEVKMNCCIITLYSNGGGKYIAGALQQYLKDKGIKHEMMMPDMLQHNGMAKHMNQTLLDKVQAMLTDTSLSKSYWYDTLQYAAHIHNIIPMQALDSITLEEAWSRNKPDVSNIQIFDHKCLYTFLRKCKVNSWLICSFAPSLDLLNIAQVANSFSHAMLYLMRGASQCASSA